MSRWSCRSSRGVARVALACAFLATGCTQLEHGRSDASDRDASRDPSAIEESGEEDASEQSEDDEPDGGEHAGSLSDAGGASASSDAGAQADAVANLSADASVSLVTDASADVDPSSARDASAGNGMDAAQDAGGNADSAAPLTDHCVSAPCLHGTCTNGASDFSCQCSGAWAGTRCDKLMFQPFGSITGMTESEARAVNGDGTVVVGQATRSAPATGFAAIQWKATTGLVQLPSSGSAQANAVAGNGLTVVGSEFPSGSSIGYATRWTGGAKDIYYASPIVNSMLSSAHALAVSADGNVAVGEGEYTNEYPKAVRWVGAAGTLERIDTGGHEESYSCGVSGNGSVVVGYTYTPDTAFVWRVGNSGLTALPTLDATRGSSARAVSQDGNVIVGSSGGLAVRWVNGAAPVSLGLAGVAYGANADGSVIVGRTGTAFVWRSGASPQLQLLADVLLSAGANLTGWTLDQATAVSADGSTVVGYGTHNALHEGFIARLR
jgi:uncharacterized membrane protein